MCIRDSPQAHGGGKVGHGLFVGPLLQNFAQMQHEHHRAGGGKIAPCHGHRDGGGVQHGDGQPALQQRLAADVYKRQVNARHMKNVPGRKTDMKDAQWIATLLRAGLLKGSLSLIHILE